MFGQFIQDCHSSAKLCVGGQDLPLDDWRGSCAFLCPIGHHHPPGSCSPLNPRPSPGPSPPQVPTPTDVCSPAAPGGMAGWRWPRSCLGWQHSLDNLIISQPHVVERGLISCGAEMSARRVGLSLSPSTPLKPGPRGWVRSPCLSAPAPDPCTALSLLATGRGERCRQGHMHPYSCFLLQANR